MARYGPADVAVTYSAQAIADCTVMSSVETLARMQEITPFGSAWETHAPTGVKAMAPITLSAPYTDDQNLLRDKADDVGLGGTATLLLGFGGTKTASVSTILTSTKRNVQRGSLTMFEMTLQPTGTVTEV